MQSTVNREVPQHESLQLQQSKSNEKLVSNQTTESYLKSALHIQEDRYSNYQKDLTQTLKDLANRQIASISDIQKMPDGRSLWIATKDGCSSKIYFYGSIHLTDIDQFPVPKQVKALVQASDFLALEDDIPPQQKEAFKQTLRELRYKIPDYLTLENKQLYLSFCEALGMTDQSQWWAAGHLYFRRHLSRQWLTKLGWKVTSMEDHFIELKGASTKVIGLEPPDEHLKEIQEANQRVEGKTFEDIQLFWNRKAPCLVKWLENYTKIAQDHKRDHYDKWYHPELTARNCVMCDSLEKAVADNHGCKIFTLVGAAHLVDDGGMQTLMKYRGWKITKLSPGIEPSPASVKTD
ncbi:TraB/GumN family protein [Sansalvadorimonas sp. 2012CJ34-2]|uniref:TraB/GumN family protein n=1 Tax=Parendozoicomonas callyspongiae TaxID=2942213 RepID=A0ABT0PGB1_9GAMM|nr:TraB/GumN family protein [Sansalvadorimonas sp. 2012CJ34-2]MCL6270408.1 TraB/GumN family protein [Sansalvadorimonas sp. 2012CJ34-2]